MMEGFEMIITYIILAGFGALLLVVVFETGFDILRQRQALKLTKHEMCKIFWCIVACCSFMSSGPIFVVCLPAVVPVALSHIQLSGQVQGRIQWQQILSRMIIVAGQAVQKISNKLVKHGKTNRP